MNQTIWQWWTQRRTIFFEVFLAMTTFGWGIDLLLTDVFASNTVYAGMERIASQQTWALFLLIWVGVYVYTVRTKWQAGRVSCLSVIAGWWAFVATMLFLVSPVSTGVIVYGSMAIVSAAAAVFNARKIHSL